jgi:hypothetical protein
MNKVCGECTACCYALAIPEIDKPRGQWCEYCWAGGCRIYPVRPRQCRQFDCAWLQTNAHEDLRPDRCGVVFEKMSNDIMWGSLMPGGEVTPLVSRQIVDFNRQGMSVILRIMDENRSRVYLAHSHTIEFVEQSLLEFLDGDIRN